MFSSSLFSSKKEEVPVFKEQKTQNQEKTYQLSDKKVMIVCQM